MSGTAEETRAYRARQKARMAIDPEYAAEVKAKRKASDRKYYENADKAKLNAQSRVREARYREENPEFRKRKTEVSKRYYWKNRDIVLVKKKELRERTVEQRAKYMAEWELRNRDKRYAMNYQRRALIRHSAEVISRSEIFDRDGGVCGICQEAVDINNWHMDHIIPLSKGGLHVKTNVQVSHPRCNLSKSNKLLEEVCQKWLQDASVPSKGSPFGSDV
jgi:5-methylcytosine-specific restriction endonuclease McrA